MSFDGKYTIIGTFDDNARAQIALEQLLAGGIDSRELSLLVSEHGREPHFVIDTGHKIPQGVAIGGIAGGTLGALTAGLSVLAGVTLPGMAVLAIGPVAAALAGAGVGPAPRGLVGGLIGLGFDEHQAKLVEKDILDGHIMLGVHTTSHRKAAFTKWAFENQHATSITA
jgi:hypothetical protein